MVIIDTVNLYLGRDLSDLTYQLRRCQSADKLVERLSVDEREEVRLGIEAVMRIKVALDRLGQRNAQLHKERHGRSLGRAKDPSLGTGRSSNAHSERLFPGAPRRFHSSVIRYASAT